MEICVTRALPLPTQICREVSRGIELKLCAWAVDSNRAYKMRGTGFGMARRLRAWRDAIITRHSRVWNAGKASYFTTQRDGLHEMDRSLFNSPSCHAVLHNS